MTSRFHRKLNSYPVLPKPQSLFLRFEDSLDTPLIDEERINSNVQYTTSGWHSDPTGEGAFCLQITISPNVHKGKGTQQFYYKHRIGVIGSAFPLERTLDMMTEPGMDYKLMTFPGWLNAYCSGCVTLQLVRCPVSSSPPPPSVFN